MVQISSGPQDGPFWWPDPGHRYREGEPCAKTCDVPITNPAMMRCGAYHLSSERRWELRGSVDPRRTGSLEFADVTLFEGRVARDRGDGHYRGDQYFLILQAAGAARMRQRGSEAILRTGDCTIIDSRYPSAFEVGPGLHQYSFHFPARVVMERLGARTPRLAQTIHSDRGAGALLSQLLWAVRNSQTLQGGRADGSHTRSVSRRIRHRLA